MDRPPEDEAGGGVTGFRHGHYAKRSPTYRSWQAMISRCIRQTNVAYARYGGAGITICAQWRRFENFLADMGERPAGTTLDRFPNGSGNYEPGNCRWATRKEQARNRKSNTLLTIGGRTQTIAEWSEETGIRPDTLQHRVARGWAAERLLDRPLRRGPAP